MTENALEGATAKTERDGQQSSYEHYSVLNGGRQSTIYRSGYRFLSPWTNGYVWRCRK